MISSLDNPKVKLIKKLKDRKKREKAGKIVIEGIHLISESLRSFKDTGSPKIEYVLYSSDLSKNSEAKEILRLLKSAGIEVFEASQRIINSLTEVESPQGIIGVIEEKRSGLSDILSSGKDLVVILEGVQDPGNLGTIIRTADAVSCAGVIVSKGTVDPFNQKTLRASMGSIFHIPVVASKNLEETINKLKANGFCVTAWAADGKESLFDEDLKKKNAFIFGSEGKGLSRSVTALADRKVRIPMPGRAESLNVAVSSSVVLYEAIRQRKE